MKKVIPVLLLTASASVYGACPYVPEKSSYVCDNVNETASTIPGQVSFGERDARSTASTSEQYGPRRRGGCVPVIRGQTVSHYDCTTHALSQVPETIERREYQTHWEQEEARASEQEWATRASERPSAMADRLVPRF